MMRRGLVGAAGIFLMIGGDGEGASAEAPGLALPVACTVGADCWPVVYFDRVASADAADYRCGRLSYDGHTGTDFAVADMAAVARGVPVVASAAGVVRNVRDGMADVDVTTIDRDSLDGRDCGNGVAISHDGEWETLYCHLRQDSIAVEPGDVVDAGDLLGFVGMSGNASFPHVELTVMHDEEAIDPFSGSAEPATADACDPGPGPLWDAAALAAMPYQPVVVTKLGFATERPEWLDVKRGAHSATMIPMEAPAFIVYVEGYAMSSGDQLEIVARDPQGAVFHRHTIEEPRAQARFFRFTGRKVSGGQLHQGRYAVSLRWRDSDGALLAEHEATAVVE